MGSTNPLYEHDVSPAVPLAEMAGWLIDAGLELAVGLLLGVAVASALRAGRLHWSWAAAALPVAVVAADAGAAGLTITSLAACLTAARLGHRRHREDLRAG